MRLGEGRDNVAFEVDGDLVVRFRKVHPELVLREARVLELVAEVSPLPVPRPLLARDGYLVYRKLPGRILLHAKREIVVAAQLGGLLAVLHGMHVDDEVDFVPLEQWLTDIPRAQRYLVGPPPKDPAEDELVFSHNDLGAEHVLVDEAGTTVTGIIDWSDAAIVDPAVDFGLILRDFGFAGLDAALGRYPRDSPALRERALFYARCKALEDLAYGLETGRTEYVDNARAALSRLNPR